MKAPALFYFIFQFALSLVQSKVIKIGALFTNALVNPQDSGRDEIRSARLAVDVINNVEEKIEVKVEEVVDEVVEEVKDEIIAENEKEQEFLDGIEDK